MNISKMSIYTSGSYNDYNKKVDKLTFATEDKISLLWEILLSIVMGSKLTVQVSMLEMKTVLLFNRLFPLSYVHWLQLN